MTPQNVIDLILMVLGVAFIAILIISVIIIFVIAFMVRNSDFDDCEFVPQERKINKKQ